ncbi:MAG: hypothetical protein IPP91_11430 [Betaproteobacteria bacterium]|nr:hypothetical protein [Betaproteobacteria bacterium]
MARRFPAWMILPAAAGLALAAAVQGAMPEYEPQQRLRTALDTCLKTEVMKGAYCVRQCGAGFKMDMSGTKPKCVGLTSGARYKPPEPQFKPPPAGARPPQGAPGY